MVLRHDRLNARIHFRNAIVAAQPDVRAHGDLARLYGELDDLDRAWSEYTLYREKCPQGGHEHLKAQLTKLRVKRDGVAHDG